MDRACAGLAAALSAFALGADLPEVKGETRGTARAAFARQVAMYLTHTAFGLSLARVAAAFRRDRSTVAHACHLMEDRRDDSGFDAWLEALETAVRAAPPPLALAS